MKRSQSNRAYPRNFALFDLRLQVYTHLKPVPGVQLIDKGGRVHMIVRDDQGSEVYNVNIWLSTNPDVTSVMITDLLTNIGQARGVATAPA